VPVLKVKALLNGMNSNPAWEIKGEETEKVLEIYNSMPKTTVRVTGLDTNRLYNGCMLEVSSNKKIHVFDGYAMLIENNRKEVRIDKNQRLEKQLLLNLHIAPSIKNLIFELPRYAEINKAV